MPVNLSFIAPPDGNKFPLKRFGQSYSAHTGRTTCKSPGANLCTDSECLGCGDSALDTIRLPVLLCNLRIVNSSTIRRDYSLDGSGFELGFSTSFMLSTVTLHAAWETLILNLL